MKVKSFALAVVILLVLGAGMPTGPTLADDHPSTYLALGNSIAVGVGATRVGDNGDTVAAWEERGYVARFHDKTLSDTALINLAVRGETSTTFLASGQLAGAVSAIALADDVQVVTLDIGGNDLLDLIFSAPCALDPGSTACQVAVVSALTAFSGNYPVILGRLTAALAADPGEESLMVMTYYNPFGGTGSPFEASVDGALLGSDGIIDCTASGFALGLNDIIACTGAAFGATVVDVHPLFGKKALKWTHILDPIPDIHPTNKGHKVIAKAFTKAIDD